MEDKAIVIYKSRTGFTKRYAELIARETGCALEDFQAVTAARLAPYRTVVFGGRLHAGRIDGWQRARSIISKSGSKHVILFATGAAPDSARETIEEMWRTNLSQEETKQIPHFYFPGGLCYEKMPFVDKAMMKAFALMMSRRSDSEEFKHMISHSYDISSEKAVKPLVELLKNFEL